MKTVRNEAGMYLGRPMGSTAGLTWVNATFAACLPEAEAATLAESFGGTVAPVPTWDAATKSYR